MSEVNKNMANFCGLIPSAINEKLDPPLSSRHYYLELIEEYSQEELTMDWHSSGLNIETFWIKYSTKFFSALCTGFTCEPWLYPTTAPNTSHNSHLT